MGLRQVPLVSAAGRTGLTHTQPNLDCSGTAQNYVWIPLASHLAEPRSAWRSLPKTCEGCALTS